MFKDKVVLITGNGSFANAMIDRLLKEEIKEIRIYSRNEENYEHARKNSNIVNGLLLRWQKKEG